VKYYELLQYTMLAMALDIANSVITTADIVLCAVQNKISTHTIHTQIISDSSSAF